MKRPGTQLVLVLSLLLNLGVIGAAGYRVVQHGQLPGVFGGNATEASLPDYLKLSAEQRRQWHELETGFLRELEADWQQIRPHRESMIREIFSDRPDRGRIEAERAVIAQLQARQQQRVIGQLLKERGILGPEQQRALAGLLIQQAPAGTFEERLHAK
jgi:Spy/CpxP family protein refolding chaperone